MLLAICCLLLASPVRSTQHTKEGYETSIGSTSSLTCVRSTQHTKEGYETKIGPTSSLTFTLTRFEYLDPADGGTNMVYEISPTNKVHTAKWMRPAQ